MWPVGSIQPLEIRPGIVPEPTLGEGEGQDDFTDRQEAHIMKRSQAMHTERKFYEPIVDVSLRAVTHSNQ